MAKKRYSDLTLADLLQWQATARRELPDAPSKEECEAAPEMCSFTTVVRGYRTVIVGKLDNGQTFAWNVNPFIAQQMLLHFIAAGQQMQWLDQHHQIALTAPEE